MSDTWQGWEPTTDRLIIERDIDATEKIGQLYVPETAKEKPTRGTVIAVGPDIRDKVSVGDEVIYGQFSGTHLTLNGDEVWVLQWADVLCRKARAAVEV